MAGVLGRRNQFVNGEVTNWDSKNFSDSHSQEMALGESDSK